MSAYAFLGAAEFEDWHTDIDRSLLDGRPGPVLVLATASAPDGDGVYQGWVDKGLAHYAAAGIDASAPSLRTPADAHDPAIVAQVDEAGLVFFSGGNPAYLSSVLQGSPVLAADLRPRGRRLARLRRMQRRGRVSERTRPTTPPPTTSSACGRPASDISPRSCSPRTGTSSRPGSRARARSSRRRHPRAGRSSRSTSRPRSSATACGGRPTASAVCTSIRAGSGWGSTAPATAWELALPLAGAEPAAG